LAFSVGESRVVAQAVPEHVAPDAEAETRHGIGREVGDAGEESAFAFLQQVRIAHAAGLHKVNTVGGCLGEEG